MDAFLNLEGGIHFVLDWILRQMRGRISVFLQTAAEVGAGTARLPAA